MENTLEQLWTAKDKSYWADTGAYDELMTKMYEDLVPSRGKALTVHGELIRAFSRLSYDYGNNGNCNAVEVETFDEDEYDTCHNCDGDGQVYNYDYDEDETLDEYFECNECGGDGEIVRVETYDGDHVITSLYQELIDFIEANLPRDKRKYVQALEEFLTNKSHGYGTYKFSDDEFRVYNELGDVIMHEVLSTENKEINYYYKVEMNWGKNNEWEHDGYFHASESREVMQTFNWYVNRIDDVDEDEKRSIRLFEANDDGDLVIKRTKISKSFGSVK